jgi:hypothetical protein
MISGRTERSWSMGWCMNVRNGAGSLTRPWMTWTNRQRHWRLGFAKK